MSSLSIKGTMRGLIISIDGSPFFDNIKAELIQKLESRKGFFREAPFCIEGGVNLAQEEKQDLINLCLDNGMVLDSSISTDFIRKQRVAARRINEHQDTDNVVINRNIRSGQKIVANKDLVVVGNVNAGAELIAGGNIVVMGSLRGLAHAGAEGDILATVTAQEMVPSQIRIAGIVACTPEENSDHEEAQTEIAYIKDNKIVVERFGNKKNIKGISVIA